MTKSGWYPDVTTDEVVRYWDGKQWRQERHWDGSEWVERPLGSPIGTGGTAASDPEPGTDAPSVEPAPPVVPVPSPTLVDVPITATVVGAPLPEDVAMDPSMVPPPPPPDAVAPTPPPPIVVPPPMARPPEATPPGTTSPGTTSPGSGWRRPAALVLLAVLVAGASAAITYFVRKDDDGTSTARTLDGDGASSTTGGVRRSTSTSSSTSSSTTSSTNPVPAPQTAPPPILGTVVNTCGASGRGDCFLSVRTAASGSASEVRRMNERDPILVVCQVPGQPVTASAVGRSSAVWWRLPDGTYVASIYVDAFGFDPYTASRPCP